MCDYSLHHVASRPAKIEDKLVVTKFNGSFTRGFAAVGEPHVAVCLLPGTEVAFDQICEIVDRIDDAGGFKLNGSGTVHASASHAPNVT
jgi:hypothetical protein